MQGDVIGISLMPWHDRKPDARYSIRTRTGPWGTVYRVAFTCHGKNVAKLFRERDDGVRVRQGR
jgi:hypothetical protein